MDAYCAYVHVLVHRMRLRYSYMITEHGYWYCEFMCVFIVCCMLSQESSQRCAAEIIAGLLCGSKNWNFKMVHMYMRLFYTLSLNV